MATPPKRVLSVGAHPDDIEIGCGGTEIKLIAAGYEVTHIFLTSGEAGSQKLAKDELTRIREKEAKKAGEILGVKEVMLLRYPDGLTDYNRNMKVEMINLIRKIQPNIVFLHATNDKANDHQILCQLMISALAAAAGPWFQETEGDPWTPDCVLGYEVWNPLSQHQLLVDITDSFEQKFEALACHQSQIEATAYDEAFKGLARYRGVMGLCSKYAEAFEVMKLTQVPANLV